MRLELLVGQSARGILQGWATGIILGLYWVYIGVILGLYWNNGKENGNYYNIRVILGLYWDNGKDNGNYCDGVL